jgi:hypothetical protein
LLRDCVAFGGLGHLEFGVIVRRIGNKEISVRN